MSTAAIHFGGAVGLNCSCSHSILTPSADHLFDRGFISFDDDGELLVSGVADVRSLKRMGADPDSPPSPLAFNRDQRHFLEFHRREVFLGAGS